MPKQKQLKNLKKGDKVMMHGCFEADLHRDKIWTCADDSFLACSGEEVVFLEGYRGYFCAENLRKV